MGHKQRFVYLLSGWFAYALFSFSMFPDLQITVMLFSIPLAMLAGWLFSYKGALSNTLLTIPYHYILLCHYSDFPSVQLEALNPFGIGTLLFFSFGTAFFRITQLRYEQLNSTLELAVQERTQDLTALTDHLIETTEMLHILTAKGLLKEPIIKLTRMKGTSNLLVQYLKDCNHPGTETAENIVTLIHICSHQLITLGQQKERNTMQCPIEEMLSQLQLLAGDKTTIDITGNWNHMKIDTIRSMHPIIHEAVTNALRHAYPRKILISIQSKPSHFIISIENDGKPIPSNFKEGMGFSLMRYRIRRLGGSLSVEAGTKLKTRIECFIPRMRDHSGIPHFS